MQGGRVEEKEWRGPGSIWKLGQTVERGLCTTKTTIYYRALPIPGHSTECLPWELAELPHCTQLLKCEGQGTIWSRAGSKGLGEATEASLREESLESPVRVPGKLFGGSSAPPWNLLLYKYICYFLPLFTRWPLIQVKHKGFKLKLPGDHKATFYI